MLDKLLELLFIFYFVLWKNFFRTWQGNVDLTIARCFLSLLEFFRFASTLLLLAFFFFFSLVFCIIKHFQGFLQGFLMVFWLHLCSICTQHCARLNGKNLWNLFFTTHYKYWRSGKWKNRRKLFVNVVLENAEVENEEGLRTFIANGTQAMFQWKPKAANALWKNSSLDLG